ncbi:glycosyltransferase family A protein [Pseudomonas brenneri]|uniref:glycosyltransferase family 2 protein n=1 Tax=Pseudomonas fluorescens group TaxID=136843 RepID=UPI001474C788|nr:MULTISPECIES: glycosyltransferase family A protein [Pseudomonas fluorescens group]NNA91278.1 glycosyltransferase family 2 protein [Pseudomonas gessardii]WJM92283.1 glycosyltransferase family A protein [Pseudomonas brenneri]
MINVDATQKKVTVAVIIPFYNGADFIERALVSVGSQTIPADEVIVVNDGSKAGEQESLYKLQEKYNFVIIDKENGGQGSARNVGVASCKCDYVCFLDQDDFYLENHIEILVESIPPRDARLGFIYADLYEADGDGHIMRTSMIKEHASHPKRSIIDLLRNDMFVLPSASLICVKAFNAVGGFDPQFTGYEDDDLFMRIFRKGYSNYYIDKPVTVWCIHSASTSYGIKMIRSRYRYFEKLCGLFPDEEDKARYYFRDCLMPRFGNMFILDAIKATKINFQHRDEVNTILKKYAIKVSENKHVSRKVKFKLRLLVNLVSLPSAKLVRFLARVRRYSLLNRIVRF